MGKQYRPDVQGPHHAEYKKNRAKILATQDVCAICGKPVDKTLTYPHPLSATVDHIIPVALGGHPSAINNLQLAHWTCNRQKSDKMNLPHERPRGTLVSNRLLPQTFDWTGDGGATE